MSIGAVPVSPGVPAARSRLSAGPLKGDLTDNEHPRHVGLERPYCQRFLVFQRESGDAP